MTDKSASGAADARAALAKLRAYATDHSDDLVGVIDSLGAFVDARTKGRYSDRIDRVQAAVTTRVKSTLKPDAPAHAADPFNLDEEPTWQQPPGGAGSRAATSSRPDVKAALVKLRGFAAEHADDVAGLVDQVGDFVDAQTKGRYTRKIDQAQALAKSQLRRLK